MDDDAGVLAAKAVVAKVRADNTATGNPAMEGMLRQALRLVSEQMYAKSTHFLFELLQNADDNQYTSSTPTLCISYEGGHLRVDCNEEGFNKDNVKAICALAESTKRNSNQYTGEKGIGFKSVFKVADGVWIHSRSYNFKLDTRQDGEFGMISPRWDEFPQPIRPGFTSFYLRVYEKYQDDLIRDLTCLDSSVLLFLRRLKNIELKVARRDGTTWSERFGREESSEGAQSITRLFRNEFDWKYAMSRYKVENLPTEDKRRGVSHSEIVLGFPILVSNSQPDRQNQTVYAFLPVRDYGLPFSLQADFLLTASREDIDDSSPWNQRLRRSIPYAFMQAIKHFTTGPLRYHLPYYIPTGNVSPPLDVTQTEILKALSKKRVLESYDNQLRQAKALVYVPPKFQDFQGSPLTLSDSTRSRYLSPNYPTECIDILLGLGVQIQSIEDFLNDLKRLEAEFPSKDPLWHSQLATALLPFTGDQTAYKFIQELDLVPIQNGKWTSTKACSVCFAESSTGYNFPSGIDIPVVEETAANDHSRRRLFEQLGVKICDTLKIAKAIIGIHASAPLGPLPLGREQLVEHATYLYKSSLRTPGPVPFSFATVKGGQALGSQVYARKSEDEDTALQRTYNLLQSNFDFIHPDYMTAIPEVEEKRLEWLSASFNVSFVPRVFKDPAGCGRPELSGEIQYLFAQDNTSDILQVLRDYWHHYSEWFEKDASGMVTGKVRDILRSAMGDLKVSCKGGGKLQLKNTVLPSLDLEVESLSNLPVMLLSDPEDSRWRFLENFGVAVKNNVQYYVRALKLFRDSEFDEHLLIHIYERIQALYDGQENSIKSIFGEKDLLYVPKGPKSRSSYYPWLTSQEAQNKLHILETQFPTCSTLFRCLLKSGDGELGRLVAKLYSFNESTPLAEIVASFRELYTASKTNSPRHVHTLLAPTLSHKFIPTITSDRESEFDTMKACTDKKLYVSDRDHLTRSFRGIVPLLALSSEDVSAMRELITFFKLDSQLLSTLVNSEEKPQGRISVHVDYTRYLKHRMCFIEALVPHDRSDRQTIYCQLRNMEAAIASTITVKHSIRVDGKTVQGRESPGQVALAVEESKLRLFFTEACMAETIPRIELIDLISSHCGIKNATHRVLLSIALGSQDLEQIRRAYLQHGIHVAIVPRPRGQDGSRRYAGSSLEQHVVESPFTTFDDGNRAASSKGYDQRLDGFIKIDTGAGFTRRRKHKDRGDPTENRALPFFLRMEHGDKAWTCTSQELEEESERHDNERLRLRYAGEVIADKFLRKQLSEYDTESHWTSDLCSRAGYQRPGHAELAAFTLTGEASKQLTSLLKRLTSEEIVYHCEVGVTVGDWADAFSIEAAQLERMRKYRQQQDQHTGPCDISILIRVSSIYSNPAVHMFVDPWSLANSGHMGFKGYPKLQAQLIGVERSIPASVPWKRYMVLESPVSDMQDHEVAIFPAHSLRYKSLPARTIRLLNLLPTEEAQGPLRGILMDVPIDYSRDFRALSYVWGTEKLEETLETPSGALNITSSLASALRHIRRTKYPMLLWVDAICINQKNDEEKKSQIKLLPHIFQHAMTTLAYLGEDEFNNRAVEALMQIAAKASCSDLDSKSRDDSSEASFTRDSWPGGLARIPKSWNGRPIPPPGDPVWGDINRFFENPWFGRIWVVQEVVESSSIRLLCGEWIVEWNDVFSAVETISKEFDSRPDYSSYKAPWTHFVQLATYREREARWSRDALIGLLEAFRYAKSTRVRDRFFALLGFCADSENPAFEPDYSSSLQMIVLRIGIAFVEQGKVMMLLYRAGIDPCPGYDINRFPSWIPDWTKPKLPCLWSSSHRGVHFHASWHVTPHVGFGTAIGELAIHGSTIDHVDAVSSSNCTEEQLRAYFHEVDKMVDNLESHPYGKSKDALKWRVPIADAKYPRTSSDFDTEMETSYRALRSVLNGGTVSQAERVPRQTSVASGTESKKKNNRKKKKGNSESKVSATQEAETGHVPPLAASAADQIANYKQAMFEMVLGWRFFTTKRGFVGIGPPATAVGDTVVVPDGSAVPFLIREHVATVSYDYKVDMRFARTEWGHRLVGECYVHGLMNGEGEGVEGREETWVHLK